MFCLRTLEQPQLDILALQLRIGFFTALLPDIFADDPAILRRTHDVVKQGRDVVPFMPIVAHASDHNTTAKAEASFEESDPRD